MSYKKIDTKKDIIRFDLELLKFNLYHNDKNGGSAIKKHLAFTRETLKQEGFVANVEDWGESNWYKSSNYSFTSFEVDLGNDSIWKGIVRRNENHFTFFTTLVYNTVVDIDETTTKSFTRKKLSFFIVNTDDNLLTDESLDYYENPYIDLNVIFPKIIEEAKTDSLYWLSTIRDIPTWVKIENILQGEQILTIDSYCYCLEELSSLNNMIFSEFEMPKLFKGKLGKPIGLVLEKEVTNIYISEPCNYYPKGQVRFEREGTYTLNTEVAVSYHWDKISKWLNL